MRVLWAAFGLLVAVSPAGAAVLGGPVARGGVPGWWRPITADWTFTYPPTDERAP